MLAGASRGALFNVTGTGETLFDRIASELSGYYLLGVESDGRDKDGKPHPIRVDVPRKGAHRPIAPPAGERGQRSRRRRERRARRPRRR